MPPSGSLEIQDRLNVLGQNDVLNLEKIIFQRRSTAVLPDLTVVEFMDAELWLQRADCKVVHGFSTVRWGGLAFPLG